MGLQFISQGGVAIKFESGENRILVHDDYFRLSVSKPDASVSVI